MDLLTFYQENTLEAGVDEAGRGCLSGPVVAAAVILPADFSHPLLNDSKKLTEAQRMILRPLIIESCVDYAIGIASVAEIDKINILQASFLAMHRAISKLKKRPELLLIDGNRFKPYKKLKHVTIIGGDGKFKAIAAASILAKTERDLMMEKLHKKFPQYNWKQNKGYGTLAHRDAIRNHGISLHHRRTFRLLPDQLSLFETYYIAYH
jgi:ribonuclease HII